MEAMDNPFYFTLGGGGWDETQPGRKSPAVVSSPAEPTQRVEVRPDGGVRYYNVRRGRSDSLTTTPTSATLPRSRPPSAHSLPSHRLSSYLIQGIKSKDMLDILIVSCKQSDTAELWVTFLTSCFQQICKEEKRPPFKLASVGVDEVVEGNPGSNGSRLQIVIVCPAFIERLGCHPAPSLLASIIQPATVVAMMLGVQPSTLDSHHLANMFHFEQWRRMVVKNQDTTFVGDFLGVSMDILSRTWQLQQAINQMKCDTNSAHFSLVPKKIKVGQNKVLVLLSDPVGTSDKINITVERNGQKIEITSFKRRNPYTLQFSMPVACMQTSMLVSVNVERNGKSLGQRLIKCESRLRELEQLLKTHNNPVNFMCQSLGLAVGSKDQLDNFLVSGLQKNIPPHFNLLSSPCSNPTSSHEEFPTLLHFGAHYGLEKFCWELLECPGGWQACSIKNGAHLCPAEIAERAGHTKLAHAIKGYTQMTELSSMYSYLKGMSDKTQVLDESNYLLPRPLSDTYAVPPAARPVSLLEYQVPGIPVPTSMSTPTTPTTEYYQTPPAARPFTPLSQPSSPLNKDFANYLLMHSPGSESLPSRFDIASIEEKFKQYDSLSCSSDQLSMKGGQRSIAGSINSKQSVQDELIEIINDFKNNVFTITEVEKLVESWRNRNDVQQSFRERQDQLEHMRQEYERIQRKMKDHMKRATPFERVKKFFSRKSKGSMDVNRNGRNHDYMCHRPLSSLSFHSSSSSSSTGRISTGSGTSLGDSGTHSDQEEKRSEEFNFHERLQSVKERSETSAGSDDYISSSIANTADLPQPPNETRPSTFSELPPTPNGSYYVNQSSLEEKTDDVFTDEPGVIKTVVEVHRVNDEKNYVNVGITDDRKEEKEDVFQNEVDDNEDEEDPLQPLEDLALLEQSEQLLKEVAESLTENDPLLEGVKTDLDCNYINVSPFPPIPPRPRYKSVLL